MSKILNGREFLAQLLADNLTQGDFEIRFGDDDDVPWVRFQDMLSLRQILEEPVVFRLKPKTRVINGFTVPAPLATMERDELYYVCAVTSASWSYGPNVYYADDVDTIRLSRGLCFATREAAIANAKAMCGINPEE